MAARLSQRLQSGSCGRWLQLCRIFKGNVCFRGLGRASSLQQDKLRTVEDLPRVSPLEMLFKILFQGYFHRMQELQIYERKLYGPIYKNGRNAVSVTTAQLLEELVRMDDKFPSRADLSLWTEYRDMRGHGYGPLTETGERWYNLRAVLNKRMLHPRDSAQYAGVINEVVTDFIKRIKHLREASSTGDFVSDVSNKFYLFSLEGIASILFDTRLGCLRTEIPAGTQEYIASISQMFSNNLPVAIFPKWSRKLLPYWGRYITSWDNIFAFAKTLIDKKIEDIQRRVDNNQNVESEYLTYLLSNKNISTKDVYASITELLLAGVDTTSNTLTWALYQLSRNPEIQHRLHEEVSTLVPADQIPTAAEVTRMPFLRAVIKETLRMYPVVPINSRIITEKTVSVGGYQFPKNTCFTLCHYAISHDESIFPEPFRFQPERWLRDGRQRPHPFSSIPFGYGVRGCVGRRIAELEMYLVLFRLIRDFKIKPGPMMDELKILSRAVLVPNKQLDLHFVDR
ncbi:sterol 26-hydroxylase, mitochondrial-like [Cyprinodon tularosa]|uniref:sterol 26-hydroxylase, mitochondrial-like n=1 Tax=Cyprinodon tularosa TaxID=77115 RepID=UPI0018E22BE6|nr:sterol 26-hydroxylase, mitochondrial-like [Cyprinodon tularosa]XP_038127201.1 sterol 26-hydroxylase, mitochondrial-like [Cyprinodon tularosa]